MTEPTPTPPNVLQSWTPPPAAYGNPYGYQQRRPTNGMAIASMVISIVGIVTICGYGVGSIIMGPLGAILGHVARKQIKERGEEGSGMALAGIIVGWVGLALGIVVLVGMVALIWWAGTLPDPNSTSYYDN